MNESSKKCVKPRKGKGKLMRNSAQCMTIAGIFFIYSAVARLQITAIVASLCAAGFLLATAYWFWRGK